MCAVWSLSARKGVLSESSAILERIEAKSMVFELIKKEYGTNSRRRMLRETFY